VGGHDEVGGQGGQVVENPRDERLEHRPVQVEAAYHGVQRAVSGQPPRVPADVDHPGVAAAGDDDQALVPDVDDEGLVVQDQRVRLPAPAEPGLLRREAGLVAGGRGPATSRPPRSVAVP
jgi:hypothetical protein